MTILRTARFLRAAAITMFIGTAVILAPCSSVLAGGSNPPNPNSDIKPGQACDTKAKDCITAQAKSHQNQGKGQQGGGDNGKSQQGKGKDKGKGKQKNALPTVNP